MSISALAHRMRRSAATTFGVASIFAFVGFGVLLLRLVVVGADAALWPLLRFIKPDDYWQCDFFLLFAIVYGGIFLLSAVFG